MAQQLGPIAQALTDQSKAIAKLAASLKTEFAQYQEAAKGKNEAVANRIAAAINKRTDQLIKLGEGLVDVVDISPDNDLPSGGGRPDAGLPKPERPTDPGYGQGTPRPDRPDNSLPNAPVRPGGGPVEPEGGTKPVEPTEPGIDNTLPSQPTTPDNTLPPTAEPK